MKNPLCKLAMAIFLATLFFANTTVEAQSIFFTTNTTIAATNMAYDGHAIIVSNATVSINGPHSFSSLEVSTNGVVSYTAGQSNLNLTVTGNMTVDLGGMVTVSGLGYGSASGPGAGGVSAGSTAGGGGGGHGGAGGSGNGGAGGAGYDSLTQPTQWGSAGGSSGPSNPTSGGAGGGAMQLTVGGVLQVNGMIAANGAPGQVQSNGGAADPGGGGAGGSLWISAQTLNGSGNITANGGNGANGAAGGGAGGRIALYFNTNSFSGNWSALGGSGYQYGGAGTIYTKTPGQSWGQLTLNNGGNAGAGTVLPGNETFDNLIIQGQAQLQVPTNDVLTLVPTVLSLETNFGLTINGQLLCAGQPGGMFAQVQVANGTMTVGAGGQLACADLQVLSGGTFVLNASNALSANLVEVLTNGTLLLNAPVSFSTMHVATNGAVSYTAGQSNLNLTVTGNLTVDLGGVVTVVGLGYGSAGGPNPGGSTGGYGAGGGGGGHGGTGGSGNGGAGGAGYDLLTEPTQWGSGGGNSYYATSGGAGGGAMQLVVGGVLLVNGMIAADGIAGLAEGGNPDPGGGGAGGSLWITAQTLSGSGSITANGGNGATAKAGGGGGGCLALYFTTNNFVGNWSTMGGSGYQYGGAGTIYTKTPSQSWGQLTLNNGGNAGAATSLSGNAQEFDNLIIQGQAQLQVPTNVVLTLVPTVLTLETNFGLTINGQLLCAGQPGGQFAQVQVANGGTMTLGAGGRLACADLQMFSGGTFVLNASNALTANLVEVLTNGTMLLNAPVSFSTMHVATNGVVSYTAGQSNLSLTVTGNLTVDLGGVVTVIGLGYGSATGPGTGGSSAGSTTGGGGGGHSGTGGIGNGGVGGAGYDSLTQPTQWGSGGGPSGPNPGSGGFGGGVTQLAVGGVLQVNGRIAADGTAGLIQSAGGAPDPGGGGAGGSLWITAQTLSGSGSITANGGSGANVAAGGGGGGCIALYFTTNNFSGNWSAMGGSGYQYGGAGTIYTKTPGQTWGQLTVDNGGNTGAGTVLQGNAQEFSEADVLGGGSMMLSSPISFSSLHVATNCLVTSTLGQSNLFLVVSGNLMLDAGGIITVSGEGYQTGGSGAGGPVGLPAPVCAGGGGYGGAGGNGVGGGLGGGVYGSASNPTDWGSAGGPNNPSMGSGGGAIRLIVGGNLTVNGILAANGSSGIAYGNPVSTSGGGAGGSIWITAGQINGAGAITANGGSGAGYGWQYSGGGGGGRVAMYYATNSFAGTVSANGGVGFQSGQQGSIYVPPNNFSLNFDVPVSSILRSPYSQDQWYFNASSGEVVQLDQISLSSAGVVFDLIGPGGWVGFTGITNMSTPLRLPLDGAYQVIARQTGGIGTVSYGFRLHQLITVTVLPQGQTVAPGSSVTFSAMATGVPSLNYQWRKNGVNLGAATNTSLTLFNVSTNDAGNYDVVVSNATGSGTNSPPSLLVVAKFLTMATLVGGAGNTGSSNGIGSNARFWAPSAVAVDSAGNVYVADTYNSTIRKITPQGIVSTVAGLAGSIGSADGTVGTARFFWPSGVAVDSTDNIYVADTYNSTIRKITNSTGVMTLAGLAGNVGSTNGTGSGARFNYPYGIAVDTAGNVYIADTYNSEIRIITTNGVVSTVAGLVGNPGSADGTNGNARFNLPQGIAVDRTGNLYVADTGNNTIRKIIPVTTNWVVSTLAGLAGFDGSPDGVGTNAQFNYPTGLAVDGAGNVYVADQGNNAVRMIAANGTVSTLAGMTGEGSANGTGSTAQFWDPTGVAVDSAGDVYVADTDNNTIRVGQFGLFAPPLLQIIPLGKQVVLFWPNSALGYVLETSGTLSPGGSWSVFTNGVETLGGNFVLTNSAGGTSGFFRLNKP